MQITQNDIREFFFNLLIEVYNDVEVEHCFLMLQGETSANRSTTTDDDVWLVSELMASPIYFLAERFLTQNCLISMLGVAHEA